MSRRSGRRTHVCKACGAPWSIYSTNHEPRCHVGRMLSMGDREAAKHRYRVRIGPTQKPEPEPQPEWRPRASLAKLLKQIAADRRRGDDDDACTD